MTLYYAHLIRMKIQKQIQLPNYSLWGTCRAGTFPAAEKQKEYVHIVQPTRSFQ